MRAEVVPRQRQQSTLLIQPCTFHLRSQTQLLREPSLTQQQLQRRARRVGLVGGRLFAQGLVMAAGKVLFGNPWIFILVSSALMCAALCWMLQAWLPPGWA